MATFHPENALSIRQLHPRKPLRLGSRLEVAPPKSTTEREYQDLLSEANTCFFQREYTIALERYLELRQKILVQSHPELPPHAGGTIRWPWDKIDPRRLFELTRTFIVRTPPGQPILTPLVNEPLVNPRVLPATDVFAPFAALGLPARLEDRVEPGTLRMWARERAVEGDLEGARSLYTTAKDAALGSDDRALAASIASESAAVLATTATGPARTRELEGAVTLLDEALRHYEVGGDVEAARGVRSNLALAHRELGRTAEAEAVLGDVGDVPIALRDGRMTALRPLAARPAARGRPTPGAPGRAATAAAATEAIAAPAFLVRDATAFATVDAILRETRAAVSTRQIGIYTEHGVETIPLQATQFHDKLVAQVYEPRRAATTLEGIWFYEHIASNFVAYIPHLYFFVLPMAIGDTYAKLGMWQDALDQYGSVRAYPYLNTAVERPYLWLRMAQVYLDWGDQLFRRGDTAGARQKYEQIVATDLTLPTTSLLYQGSVMATMVPIAQQAIARIEGEAHEPVNPRIVQAIMSAHIALQRIAAGLNFLGLRPDDAPIFRFKYLQAVANYLADNAVQAERSYIQFFSTAEAQKLERLQLQNAVELNQAAVAVEQERLADAALEQQAARRSREYTQMRATHAQQALDEWNTSGWELEGINNALSWASNAANDQKIRYTGVRYRGETHDFETDVEEFYDVLGDWKQQLSWEMQRNRLQRQRDEIAAEIGIAQIREQQAAVRYQVQRLSVELAQVRLEGSRELLDFSQDKLFDEDMWYRLAGDLQELARSFLDMAIHAAYLMQQAYNLELDRDLDRIRLDYGIAAVSGTGNMLGGDQLKRDIASFTADLLQHAQKKDPVRVMISLREEFPAEFALFVRTGILPFRTDLEVFDRRHPGTHRRKLKQVEIFVEGLVPLEGATGTLVHEGVSTEWAPTADGWGKRTRVLASETMTLSSYQLRRDLSVFQPSEEMLGLFENFSPQGNWRLELPRSTNNIDYEAISDIKLVVYFTAQHDDSLRAHQREVYGMSGGRSVVLSSRFHFPDEYFRLDAERGVTFQLHPARFAYNHVDLELAGLGVRLLGTDGQPLAGRSVEIVRASDGSRVAATTDAEGLVGSDPTTMAPFAAWQDDSPIDSFTVALGDDVDPAEVTDIHLLVDYAFDHRPDGVLS
jgi:hypothetical protein